MEERYSVSTPENVSFSFDVAGIGTRFLAALIDLIIYLLVSLALSIAYSRSQQYITDEHVGSVITAIYIGFTFGLYWAYYILFEIVWAGQSPGKRLIHIRVVRMDGTPASAVQIVIRNIARLVDMFPGFYAIGFAVMFASGQSRRLGDFAAGTLVVREESRASIKPVLLASTGSHSLSPKAQAEAAMLPVHMLSDVQRRLIRDFIQRREQIGESQRARFALQIASSAASQMGAAIPTQSAQAEYFLELIAGSIDN